MSMTAVEFCKKVLAQFKGQWPYPGALADAHSEYKDGSTVDRAVANIKTQHGIRMKKHRAR